MDSPEVQGSSPEVQGSSTRPPEASVELGWFWGRCLFVCLFRGPTRNQKKTRKKCDFWYHFAK